MISKSALRTLCAAVLSLSGLVAIAQLPVAAKEPAAKVATAYGNLPLQFEVNQGQVDANIKMMARGQGYNILLQPTAATFDLHKTNRGGKDSREVVSLSFAGASKTAALATEQKLPGYVNYMHGSDASKWQTGVPTFARVRTSAVYPGVDVVYYGTGRQLEFDMVVAAGTSTDAIQLSIAGAKPVLEGNGELVLAAGADVRAEDVRLRKPVLYQVAGDKREPVDGAFTLAKNGEVGFRIGSYDHSRELVIDPIISYGSYFGGAAEDEINGSALNAANQLYVVGQTFSTSLPGTAGEFQTGSTSGNNGHDAFVTKFSADGSTVLWTTYLSGSADDAANSVAVNAADQAYIVGYTNSCASGQTTNQNPGEFPFTADAVQPLCNPQLVGFNNFETNGSGYDVFLVKLSSDGKTELYGTPLGGTQNDFADSIVLDAAGRPYIVGETSSTGYYKCAALGPHCSDVPSYPMDNHGSPDIGVANYPTTQNAFYSNTAESQQYATTDSSGNSSGPQDEQAFITVLSADLHSLVYSSLIGGTNLGGSGNGTSATNGIAVAVNAAGQAFIGGNTSSAHWPTTTGAFAPTCSNAGAASSTCYLTGWLAGFDPSKSGTASLLFSTYMNGSSAGTDSNGNAIYPASDVYGLAVDSNGNVVATGDTNANNFPTTAGTFQPACKQFGDSNGNSQRCQSAFVTKLSPTGATVWSSYFGPASLGGIAPVVAQAVALDANDNVYVAGTSSSPSLPMVNAIDANTTQSNQLFVIELSPTGTTEVMGTFIGSGNLSLDNNALHLDSNLNAYISGYQAPNNIFPITANAFSNSIQGTDGWVLKLITQMQPSATALTVNPTTTAKPTDTVTLTANVTTSSTLTGSILPSGTVTFLNGATTIGTATLNATGVATYTGMLPTGTYNIIASYAGDAGFNPSVSQASSTLTVTTAVATTTALTVAPASVPYGTASTLTATVLAGTVPATSGSVSFAAGSVSLGSANVNSSGVATLAVTPAVGMYSVVASYAGTVSQSNASGFASSTSVGVALNVTKAATTTALTSSTTSAGTGMNITLTATVSGGAPGLNAPSGVVTFLNGTTPLGTATATAGVATLVTTFSTAANYSITAVYAGDTNYTGSTSTTLTQAVVTPNFSVLANPASLTVARGSSATTTLTFTPVGGFSGVVSLACGTLPANATCTFAPASLTLAGSPLTSSLTISTGSLTARVIRPTLQHNHHSEVVSAGMATFPALLLSWLVCYRRKRFSKSIRLIALLLAVSVGLMAGGITGCSSSPASSAANATPAGSYSVPLSFAGPQGTLQTVTLSVTVQ